MKARKTREKNFHTHRQLKPRNARIAFHLLDVSITLLSRSVPVAGKWMERKNGSLADSCFMIGSKTARRTPAKSKLQIEDAKRERRREQ